MQTDYSIQRFVFKEPTCKIGSSVLAQFQLETPSVSCLMVHFIKNFALGIHCTHAQSKKGIRP